MLFLILIGVILIISLYYYKTKSPKTYWIKRHVKQTSPLFLFGDNFKALLQWESSADMLVKIYNAHPETRYSGTHQFAKPVLLIRDPELIKQIAIKDFDHFMDRYPFVPPNIDLLWSSNLFALRGQKWRDMRAKLSPAFTSSKMRQFFTLISENGERFVEYFRKQNEKLISVELKDIFTRFTNDVIASIAFGIKCDSLTEPNNEFYTVGSQLVNFAKGLKNLKFVGYVFFPKLFSYLKISVFTPSEREFFINLMKETIKAREEQGIVRPDLINLLLEARKNGYKRDEKTTTIDTGFATVEESEMTNGKKMEKAELTDLDITAQAVLFFFAGFASVSSLMCFMAYELAVNSDIQKRLQQEIDKTRKECDGTVTYEALLKMKYLDMVVSETLRKWPNAIAIDRICVKPYTIQPVLPDESPVTVDKDELIWLPIFALHRDPKYFPDPEKFDPERFSDENREKIVPYSYIPFGVGPRNCIGSRFALLETKILFFHLLTNFEVVPTEKSQIPVEICRKDFNLNAGNGFWFAFKPRD